MLDNFWCAFLRLANYTVSGIVFELEREKFKGKFTESRIVSEGRVIRALI